MDIDLDDDQLEYRRLMREFTDREVRPVAREMEQSGTYPAEIVEKMGVPRRLRLLHGGRGGAALPRRSAHGDR